MTGAGTDPLAVLVDGEPVGVVPVVDRGFLYGDALFEVLPTHRGEPAYLGRHLERMAAGGALLGFRQPCPREAFEADVARLVREAGPDLVLRLFWSRGDGAGIPAEPPMGRRVSMAFPLRTLAAEAYAAGVECVLVPGRATVLPGAKVAGYAANVLATRAARSAGAHEALFEDDHGRIEEGATSNLFAVHAGGLVTPPADRILPGITRAVVLEIARELAIPVRLEPLERGFLGRADELFLTSSVRELLPVRAVQGVSLGPPGPVTRRLTDAYRARLGQSPRRV